MHMNFLFKIYLLFSSMSNNVISVLKNTIKSTATLCSVLLTFNCTHFHKFSSLLQISVVYTKTCDLELCCLVFLINNYGY